MYISHSNAFNTENNVNDNHNRWMNTDRLRAGTKRHGEREKEREIPNKFDIWIENQDHTSDFFPLLTTQSIWFCVNENKHSKLRAHSTYDCIFCRITIGWVEMNRITNQSYTELYRFSSSLYMYKIHTLVLLNKQKCIQDQWKLSSQVHTLVVDKHHIYVSVSVQFNVCVCASFTIVKFISLCMWTHLFAHGGLSGCCFAQYRSAIALAIHKPRYCITYLALTYKSYGRRKKNTHTHNRKNDGRLHLGVPHNFQLIPFLFCVNTKRSFSLWTCLL